MSWNPSLYDNKHNFVSKYGEDVIGLLAPQSGEFILDLGCGTGDLAQQIAQSGAKVLGIDASAEMIAQAQQKYPNIHFEVHNAENFELKQPVDAIFSNATLHWVLNPEACIQQMYKALKPGGRLVVEFGGQHNVASILNALKSALDQLGYHDLAQKDIWFFPSLAHYSSLLETQGFRVNMATHFDRETPLDSDLGLRNWIKMFAPLYLKHTKAEDETAILDHIENQLKPNNLRDGIWYADYKRLRIFATKN